MKNLVIASTLLLAACGGGRPELTVFTLKPEMVASESSCRTGRSIQVNEPVAGAGLDSRRIAVMQNQSQINYYNDIRWAAPASEMLQAVLVELFDQSGKFKSVEKDGEGVSSDLTLLTDLRDFQVTDAANPTVKIRLRAKLINSESRRVLATIPVEREVSPTANKTDSIIAAFTQASNEVAEEIVSKSGAAVSRCR